MRAASLPFPFSFAKFISPFLFLLSIAPAAETPAASKQVDFATEIRPILAQHCWSCHGQDEAARKGKLRLDLRDKALAKKAIVPSDPSASEMIKRINSTDDEELMPPPENKKPLNPRQKQLLQDWIKQGANYAQHWAFVAPRHFPPPEVQNAKWPRNAIDHFVLQRLEQENLSPSPEADRATLIRRVTLDLTGLPPTEDEVSAFVADTSPQAYEKVVDRLLASPRYGERMALAWLDAARYADTNGYNNDEDRSMWPWRDWVINAFNKNMPYDRFIVEQLAGDLLPAPTQSQIIATAFHRNQGHNTEGGIIQEEYRVEYVADRVHTTATIFLGLSMQCARCHDHKFDPLTQKEYYRFFAFYNSMEEKQASYVNFSAAEPFIKVPSTDQQAQLRTLEETQHDIEKKIDARKAGSEAAFVQFEKEKSPDELKKLAGMDALHRFAMDETEGEVVHDSLEPTRTGTIKGKAHWAKGKVGGALEFDGQTFVDLGALAAFDGTAPFSISAWVHPSVKEGMAVLSKMDESAEYRGYDVLLEDGKVVCHLIHAWPGNAIKVITRKAVEVNAWTHLLVTYNGSRSASGLKIYMNGNLEALDVASDTLKETAATDKSLHLGRRQTSLPFKGQLGEVQFFGRNFDASDAAQLCSGKSVAKVCEVLKIADENRSPEQRALLGQFYLERVDPEYPHLKSELAECSQKKTALEKTFPAVMVMKDMPKPRDTFLLKRGQYDKPDEKVTPDVPAFLPPLPADAPHNRLGMARWLVSPEHPLTARVAVNRWWQQIFGAGLVRTVEDFGTTGESPSHPQLLDYLATELVQSGWDVKAMQKLMVMSATYCQSSRTTPELEEKDPENRLLARGARYRLPAEVVRDNALAISGLLHEHVGGPSVKPYQPEGLWEDVSVERRAKYVADQGDGLYRRSLYTFWKRTCPPPALSTFDAPNREVCLARRARTNTPLQALILLNDTTYVEAARKLAERVITLETQPVGRLQRAFHLALARSPGKEEEQILTKMYANALDHFHHDPAEANKLLAVGHAPRLESQNPEEVAAWTIVCSTLLNLDETISKR